MASTPPDGSGCTGSEPIIEHVRETSTTPRTSTSLDRSATPTTKSEDGDGRQSLEVDQSRNNDYVSMSEEARQILNGVDSMAYTARQNDGDSTFGDTSSSTATLASSIMHYRYENGRRYHSFRPGSYFYPNDEIEQDRLDVIHHMTDLVLEGRLFLAPITSHPHRILDLGTGTGIWAIDVGDMFPSAEVIGNDLSPIQPDLVPPNVRFEVDDIEDPWLFKTPFDFIHARYLSTGIRNWPRLISQAYRNLRPGSWVEFVDYDFHYQSDDGSLTPDLAMVQNGRLVVDACKRIGREPCPGPKLEGWLQDAGFVNVTEQCFKLPIGPWARDKKWKEIGTWNLYQFLQGAEAWSMAILTKICGWTADEVRIQVAQVRNDGRNRDIHSYYTMHIVYGQKPGT